MILNWRKEQKLTEKDFFNVRRIRTGDLLTIIHQKELINKENLGLEKKN